MYYALRRSRGQNPAFLSVEYSFENVPDPMIIDRSDRVPATFMDSFQLTLLPGKVEDYVSNDVWYLLSPRVISILKTARNANDLNLIPLPATLEASHPELAGYCAVGIRRQLECLDKKASDVRWSKRAPGALADAVYDAVVIEEKVPNDCDVFLLKEWPVVPILRDTLGRKLEDLGVTGLKLQPFRTSTRISD